MRIFYFVAVIYVSVCLRACIYIYIFIILFDNIGPTLAIQTIGDGSYKDYNYIYIYIHIYIYIYVYNVYIYIYL